MSIKPTPPPASGAQSSQGTTPAPSQGATTAPTTGTPSPPGDKTTSAGQTNDAAAASLPDTFGAAAQSSNFLGMAAGAGSFLIGGFSKADILSNFPTDSLPRDVFNQGVLAGATPTTALLQAFPAAPSVSELVAAMLDALTQLAFLSDGLLLDANALTLLATLNGSPATLLDNQTEPNALWRALTLSNPPLNVPTFAATGKQVDKNSGLLAEQAYRVRGTFVDENETLQVRLETTTRSDRPTDEEGMLKMLLTVPFLVLQRAMLLALLADARPDLPYNNALDETHGPTRAECCLFTHATGAAAPLSQVTQNPSSLSEPRCQSCPFGRQIRLAS